MGRDTNSYDRIRSNLTSHNSAYATLSNLRKDHKPIVDPIKGPPGRPLCGANVAFNHRLSHILSILLIDCIENEETECGNTEELIAEFERINVNGVSENFIIGSMDVKAMYPSLDIPFTVAKVCEIFQNCDIEIKGVDYREAGLYVALNKTQREIDDMGMKHLYPQRKRARGPRPTITGSGMKENIKERHDPWIFPDIEIMTEIEKKSILTQALNIGLMTVMTSHIYEFNGELRKQKNGGAIGMELTGTLAKVFMVWWDKIFLNKLEELSIMMPVYKRYVDDINCGLEFVNGTYDDTKIKINLNNNITDEVSAKDEITMELLKNIGNNIHKSIQLETEYPSKFSDNKLPILDLKVWVQEVREKRIIMYEHYKKDISSKAMIFANSAIPMNQKRTIITQEILRIMTHCSQNLNKETRNSHINEVMKRIQYCGYSKEFRYDVFNSAKKAYNLLIEKEARGDRPLHRPKGWKKDDRKIEKRKKKEDWYKRGGYESVIMVPCTPNMELKNLFKEAIKKSELRIQVLEKPGTKIKSIIHRSNPFKKAKCRRNDCFVCNSNGKGPCDRENINYDINCEPDCIRKNVYRGESSKNSYSRGKEHKDSYLNKTDDSTLWRHCLEYHNGEEKEFSMSVRQSFNDSMSRQICEAVYIRRTPNERLMNSRSEWNTAVIPTAIIRNNPP